MCLDIEGGYGGSSRSLFESIRYLPTDVKPEVWCRRQGPIRERYAAIGIPCHITGDMPHISSLPRASRNLYAYTNFLARWAASRGFRRMLAEATKDFDVIHFNHEGLFLLARWLRRHLGNERPHLTMHIRTFLPSSFFSRWQYRMIVSTIDQLVFISENEARQTSLLAGRIAPGTVIYNIVSPPADAVRSFGDLAADKRFKVVAISNYAYIRGIDQLIEVAAELKDRGRKDIVFVIAGATTLTRSLPGDLGRVARAGGDLAEYARERGVSEMFRFLGHVTEPESVVLAGDLVVKPTREYNPWGRDILEAMAAGKAVMTIGAYNRFIENGVTGILHYEFDIDAWADEVIRWAEDPVGLARLGMAAQERVLKLCDGPSRARDLYQLWAAAAAKAENPCAA